MTNNKMQVNATGEAEQSVGQTRIRLLEWKKELGSFHVLADELGVNVAYVYEFLERGIVPKNKQVRRAMGIRFVSRGARIYRALNEKAQAAGWESWSEYSRAVLNGDVPLTSKTVAAYYANRD